MNRDELLELCFGRTDLPAGQRILEVTDAETNDVLSHLDLSYRRVIVRLRRPASGASIADASETLTVAAIANVATDPDHRALGHATGLIEWAHREAAEHGPVRFAALFAGTAERGFYERLGYRHPVGASENFLVCPLGDDQWPDGSVDTRGEW